MLENCVTAVLMDGPGGYKRLCAMCAPWCCWILLQDTSMSIFNSISTVNSNKWHDNCWQDSDTWCVPVVLCTRTLTLTAQTGLDLWVNNKSTWVGTGPMEQCREVEVWEENGRNVYWSQYKSLIKDSTLHFSAQIDGDFSDNREIIDLYFFCKWGLYPVWDLVWKI